MKKRGAAACLAAMVSLCLTSCSWADVCPASMELLSPPDKLVYTLGKDTELDLTGATVRGWNYEDELLWDEIELNKLPMYVFSQVDFAKAGVYVVTVGGNDLLHATGELDGIFFQFTVQVAAGDWHE